MSLIYAAASRASREYGMFARRKAAEASAASSCVA
jgi:hypothetical protein